MGRDSSAGIATCYGLDGPVMESRWGRDFLHPSRPALGSTQSPIQWLPGLFPKSKAAETWLSPPTLSSTKVKGRVELHLYSPYDPLFLFFFFLFFFFLFFFFFFLFFLFFFFFFLFFFFLFLFFFFLLLLFFFFLFFFFLFFFFLFFFLLLLLPPLLLLLLPRLLSLLLPLLLFLLLLPLLILPLLLLLLLLPLLLLLLLLYLVLQIRCLKVLPFSPTSFHLTQFWLYFVQLFILLILKSFFYILFPSSFWSSC